MGPCKGELRLSFADGPDRILSPGKPAIVEPQQIHWVEPLGSIRMQIEFYEEAPGIN